MYQESYERNSQLYFDEKKRKVTQPMCMSFVEQRKNTDLFSSLYSFK